METSGKRICCYSLLMTALLAGIYQLGHGIPLPGINSEYFSPIDGFATGTATISIFSLGYAPFLAGFVLVEIFSLILPAGRRLRSAGCAGRAKLNRAAIGTSIVLCVFQSFTVALTMEKIFAQYGFLLVTNPGWPFRLMTCVTLTTGSICILYIARLISLWGIANGFCILIAYSILTPFIGRMEFGIDSFQKIGTTFQIEYFGFLALALLLLFAYYRKPVTTTMMTSRSQSSVTLDLPLFPQGVVPLVWAFSVFNLLSLLGNDSGFGAGKQFESFWILLLGTTVLIMAFSAIGVALFSSRNRIVNNLPPGAHLDDNVDRLIRNQSIKGASVLALGSAVLLALERQFGWVHLIDYASLIFLAAITMDVIEQWRFSWNHGRGIELMELDNPHLASYLRKLLKSNGIDTVVQTYHYRRLSFFFSPLTKMRVLVAPKDGERARELIDCMNIKII
jgi:hypothetical protein